jgi:pyruvate/2-oxoglutarate dehydrogenase complex dihydrolipoamide dehydrogenase (E3) component
MNAVIGALETGETRGFAYRLFKISMAAVMRVTTLSETRGFLKALVEVNTDRIVDSPGSA